MATTLDRNLGPVADLIAGEFTRNTPSGRAALSCPMCGHVFDLQMGIVPGPDGLTSLRVPCPAARCGFLDYVLLADHWL